MAAIVQIVILWFMTSSCTNVRRNVSEEDFVSIFWKEEVNRGRTIL
jgi:hypothetical protein